MLQLEEIHFLSLGFILHFYFWSSQLKAIFSLLLNIIFRNDIKYIRPVDSRCLHFMRSKSCKCILFSCCTFGRAIMFSEWKITTSKRIHFWGSWYVVRMEDDTLPKNALLKEPTCQNARPPPHKDSLFVRAVMLSEWKTKIYPKNTHLEEPRRCQNGKPQLLPKMHYGKSQHARIEDHKLPKNALLGELWCSEWKTPQKLRF